MELLAAIGIPAAAVVGGLIGGYWGKREARRASVGDLLISQLDSLWSDLPRRRQAARDSIRGMMVSGMLSKEQMLVASNQLKNWAAVNWELTEDERQRLELGLEDASEDASTRGGRAKWLRYSRMGMS